MKRQTKRCVGSPTGLFCRTSVEISKNSVHPIDRDIFLQPCIFDDLTIADAKPRYLTNRMDQKVSKCTKWGIFPSRDHTIPRRRPHFDNLLLHFTTVNVSQTPPILSALVISLAIWQLQNREPKAKLICVKLHFCQLPLSLRLIYPRFLMGCCSQFSNLGRGRTTFYLLLESQIFAWLH